MDPSKAKKHGKAAAKSTGQKYQFQIMLSMGVERDEIHKFADSKHWLYYFPPRAIEDLKLLGVHVDWRRSFITTDINPYYDSFIRWQFNKLRNLPTPRIQFGERYTVYSPLDGQACMDHDRSVGEGVAAQEYTGIKIKVLFEEIEGEASHSLITQINGVKVGAGITSPEFKAALGNRSLFLVAATLRPETMYGQTNCFVGVDIKYGVYAVNETEAWVCTERAAKNMSWQSLFAEKGVLVKLAELTGRELVGVPVSAPLSCYQKVYVLPMEGVLANKGTGVVTSVPSDSPDDYITIQDLIKKPAYYSIKPEWIQPFSPPVPIIKTPNYGDLAAVTACTQLKIQSQKDKVQLAAAKEAVYKEGFYNGVMLVGECAGLPVQEAKPRIRSLLIASGAAFAYCEPDGLVISRSGDECVVTLADQWYPVSNIGSWISENQAGKHKQLNA